MTKREKNPRENREVLQDAKLLEILGSGLDRNTLRPVKDFRMFPLL